MLVTIRSHRRSKGPVAPKVALKDRFTGETYIVVAHENLEVPDHIGKHGIRAGQLVEVKEEPKPEIQPEEEPPPRRPRRRKTEE